MVTIHLSPTFIRLQCFGETGNRLLNSERLWLSTFDGRIEHGTIGEFAFVFDRHVSVTMVACPFLPLPLVLKSDLVV